jgi:hypothetical protein
MAFCLGALLVLCISTELYNIILVPCQCKTTASLKHDIRAFIANVESGLGLLCFNCFSVLAPKARREVDMPTQTAA